ncbi:unusual floral organs-like protein, partial [Tanacetum coccineum]
MWDNLPSDVLANVFSYLTPCSLARAMAACRYWHDCGRETRQICRHRQPWFIALPPRSTNKQLCFVHDPIQRSWHLLNFEHVPSMTRPVSTIGGQGLILFNSTRGVPIWLSVCNPFTGQFGHLPHLDKWKELGVPMGDTLEFATLVLCDGKVAVVGGTHDGNVLVWELGDGDEWILIERMPLELAKRFAGSSTKVVITIEWMEIEVYTRISDDCLLARARTFVSKCEDVTRDTGRKVGSSTLPNDWKGIIDALVKLNNDNAIRSILRNERNKRLFDKESRNMTTLVSDCCGWYLQMTTL